MLNDYLENKTWIVVFSKFTKYFVSKRIIFSVWHDKIQEMVY